MDSKLILALSSCLYFFSTQGVSAVLERCYNNQGQEDRIKWDSNEIVFYGILNNSPLNGWSNSLKEATRLFNNNPSSLRYEIKLSTNDNPTLGNGYNEIHWTHNPVVGGVAETATLLDNNCRIIEKDIRFKIGGITSWTTSLEASELTVYGGRYRQIIPTILHEMGHAAELMHEGRYYNLMGNDEKHVHRSGSQVRPYLGEDVAEGLVSLYGKAYNRSYDFNDVSVSHWERTAENCAQDTCSSKHSRIPLYNTSWGVLPVEYKKEPYYKVKAGSQVNFVVLYENNGLSRQKVFTEYYLSADHPNDTISRNDIYLDWGEVELERDRPDKLYTSLIIPDFVAPGYYRLGVIIDPNDNLIEMDENNTTYVGVKVE